MKPFGRAWMEELGKKVNEPEVEEIEFKDCISAPTGALQSGGVFTAITCSGCGGLFPAPPGFDPTTSGHQYCDNCVPIPVDTSGGIPVPASVTRTRLRCYGCNAEMVIDKVFDPYTIYCCAPVYVLEVLT